MGLFHAWIRSPDFLGEGCECFFAFYPLSGRFSCLCHLAGLFLIVILILIEVASRPFRRIHAACFFSKASYATERFSTLALCKARHVPSDFRIPRDPNVNGFGFVVDAFWGRDVDRPIGPNHRNDATSGSERLGSRSATESRWRWWLGGWSFLRPSVGHF